MTFIPYPGMPPAINAVLGQHVTAAFGNYGDLIEQIKAGKLRALAVATQTRIETLPDVPPSLNWVIRILKRTCVMAWLRRREHQGRLSLGWSNGLRAPCRDPKSNRNSLPWEFRSSGRAARISRLFFASDMRTMGALFARRTSKWSDVDSSLTIGPPRPNRPLCVLRGSVCLGQCHSGGADDMTRFDPSNCH